MGGPMGMPGGPMGMPGGPMGMPSGYLPPTTGMPTIPGPIVVTPGTVPTSPPPPTSPPSSVQVQVGTSSNDTLSGTAGSDEFRMVQGTSLGGTDTLSGGTGTDQLTLQSLSGVKCLLDGSATSFTLNLTGAVTSTISATGVERVSFAPASGQDVTIDLDPIPVINIFWVGTSAGDIMNISSDNATRSLLYGGGGNDTITLRSGGGEDIVAFVSTTHGADTIANFQAGTDNLSFLSSAFGGGTGDLTASEFSSGTTGLATTAAHRFIFDTDDKKLYFDVDGSGATPAVHVATTTGVNITHADIQYFS